VIHYKNIVPLVYEFVLGNFWSKTTASTNCIKVSQVRTRSTFQYKHLQVKMIITSNKDFSAWNSLVHDITEQFKTFCFFPILHVQHRIIKFEWQSLFPSKYSTLLIAICKRNTSRATLLHALYSRTCTVFKVTIHD